VSNPRGRYIHGGTGSRLHAIWTAMQTRCRNPNQPNYKHYGGRGVTMCQEWDHFEPFREWALSHGYADHLSIDRYPHNNGNYEPGNCRWATREEQNRNKRTNHMITWLGEAKCIADWAEDPRFPVSAKTIVSRLKRGWDEQRAVSVPPRKKARNL